MKEQLPEGTLLKIEAEIRLPVDATKDQIVEWLHYSLFQSGGCSLDNPLLNEEAEDWHNSFEWKDTGMVGHREEFDHQKDADGATPYPAPY